jgi:hypothetical protein
MQFVDKKKKLPGDVLEVHVNHVSMYRKDEKAIVFLYNTQSLSLS